MSFSGYSGVSGASGASGASSSIGIRSKNKGYGSQPIDESNGFVGRLIKSTKWFEIKNLSQDDTDFILAIARHPGDRPWIKISALSKKMNFDSTRTKSIINRLNEKYPYIIYEATHLNVSPEIDNPNKQDYEVAYWENYISFIKNI